MRTRGKNELAACTHAGTRACDDASREVLPSALQQAVHFRRAPAAGSSFPAPYGLLYRRHQCHLYLMCKLTQLTLSFRRHSSSKPRPRACSSARRPHWLHRGMWHRWRRWSCYDLRFERLPAWELLGKVQEVGAVARALMEDPAVAADGGLIIRIPIRCTVPNEIVEFTQAFTPSSRPRSPRHSHHRLMVAICIEMPRSNVT